MKQNELDFLHKISENTEMGIHAIDQLLPIVENAAFKKLLNEQHNDYKEIYYECCNIISENGEKNKRHGTVGKLMSSAGIKINTLLNKTPTHIAEMMISGSTMGINQVTKELNERGQLVSKESKELADKLLHIEQNNIDRLRSFL